MTVGATCLPFSRALSTETTATDTLVLCFFCFSSLSVLSEMADINFLYIVNTVHMGIHAFLLSDLFFTEV